MPQSDLNNPPRILLVGNYVPDRQHSMLRYSDWLASALRRQGYEVTTVAPRLRLARFAGNGMRKWFAFLDKFLLFAPELNRLARRHDLVHICDHSNAPYALVVGSRAVSITCHDLIPIKVLCGEVEGQRLARTAACLQRLIRFALRYVANVAYVSEATKDDFVRLIAHPYEVSEVIPNPVIGFGGMTQDRALSMMKQAGLPADAPFLLHVGSNLWYKNRTGTVGLFGLLRSHPGSPAALQNARLICVGPPLPDEAKRSARDWKDNLIVVSEASPELIEALYTRAEALLYPSLDEGFGWPIIEAQACGCPVITTDREPMREIAGPYALLINPRRPEEAAATIVNRWSWLMMHRGSTRAHAASFSEPAAAARYAEFFARVLAAHQGRFKA